MTDIYKTLGALKYTKEWQGIDQAIDEYTKGFMIWEPSHIGKSIFMQEARKRACKAIKENGPTKDIIWINESAEGRK